MTSAAKDHDSMPPALLGTAIPELGTSGDNHFSEAARTTADEGVVNGRSESPAAQELTFESYMLAPMHPTLATVDGWPINLAGPGSAVETIAAAARRGDSFTVFTLNLDHLVKLRSNGRFRAAYASARYVAADGAPVASLAARQNARIERTTGADLAVPLAEAAARDGTPIYLFGTSPGVIASAGRSLAGRCQGPLDIVGSASPSAGFDPEGPEADAALGRIAASGARLVFVALGAPEQEIFAARAARRGVKAGFVCIGAALDFIAGAQERAPKDLRSNGLEWLWRLAASPPRLATRYALYALVLADLLIRTPLRSARPASG